MNTRKRAVKQGKLALHAALLAGILALAAVAPRALADVGVGVAVLDNIGVLVPIRTESMMIEPGVFYFSQSSAQQVFRNSGVDIGIYWRKELGAQFESYIGARIGYSYSKQDSNSDFFVSNQKSTFLNLTPTFGIQYFFAKQFSLGLDVGLRYFTGTREFTFPGFPEADNTEHIHGFDTQARVLVRGFF